MFNDFEMLPGTMLQVVDIAREFLPLFWAGETEDEKGKINEIR